MVSVPLARQQTLTRPQSTARLAMDGGAGRELQSALGGLGEELDAWRDSIDEGIARDADLEFNGEIADILSGEDGYFRQRGRAGAEGLDGARESLEDAHRRAMEGLTPGARRRMGGVANNRLIRAMQGATDHAVRERDAWIVQAAQARQGRALQDAIAARHDPAEVAAQISLGLQELDKEGATLGWAAPFLAEKKAAYASGIHAGIAESLAITDPRAGLAYLEAHKGDILETDEIQLRKAFHDEALRRDGADFARGAFAGAYESKALRAALAGGKWRAAVDILRPAVIQQETGGKPGQISPKGALGVMQVMPDTGRAMARLLGIEYDADRLLNDDEYNIRIGTEYLFIQLREYGGNVALALAAYNAGPGRLDGYTDADGKWHEGWLTRFGDPRKGEISVAEFMAKVPFKETRDYVAAIMGNVRARDPWAEAMAIEDPDARAAALTELRTLEAGVARRNKREAAANAAAALAHVEGGGSVDDMPLKMRLSLGRAELSALRSYEKNLADLAEGEAMEVGDEVAYELRLMAANRPEEFKKLRLLEYRDQLSDADWNKLVNAQTALLKDKHARVTYGGADAAIKDIAPGVFDFNAEPDSPKGLKLRNLREPLWREIEAFTAREGRAPDTAEMHDMVRRLLTTVPGRGDASLFGHATDLAARIALGPIAGGLFGDEFLGEDATALDLFAGGERTVGEIENEAFNAATVDPGPPSARAERIVAAFKDGFDYSLRPGTPDPDGDYTISPEKLAYVERIFTIEHERAPASLDELVDYYLGTVDAGRARAAAAETARALKKYAHTWPGGAEIRVPAPDLSNPPPPPDAPQPVPVPRPSETERALKKYAHTGPGGPERFPRDLSDAPDPPPATLPATGGADAAVLPDEPGTVKRDRPEDFPADVWRDTPEFWDIAARWPDMTIREQREVVAGFEAGPAAAPVPVAARDTVPATAPAPARAPGTNARGFPVGPATLADGSTATRANRPKRMPETLWKDLLAQPDAIKSLVAGGYIEDISSDDWFRHENGLQLARQILGAMRVEDARNAAASPPADG